MSDHMVSKEVNLPVGLSSGDVSRYSRQMLVSDIGGGGQSKISRSKVLICGAGGLGSAVIATLAGAGVGTLGIIDPDVVDTSNLHRQTIHKEADSGSMLKALSAARFVNQLNSSIDVTTFCEVLDHTNVINIINQFDVVVDASDNPKTRYLLSDACVISNKPLISGSAVGLEGQLTVYNYKSEANEEVGPCYRCVYPNPPKTAASCSDSGVVGMVPAVIGNLQGLEVLKVIAGFGDVLSGELVMYDARGCNFHKFKVKRRDTCSACGKSPTIVNMDDSLSFSLSHGLRGLACETCLPLSDTDVSRHYSVTDYQQIRVTSEPHILIDVREPVQYNMCHLSGSINIPLSQLEKRLNEVQSLRDGKSKREVTNATRNDVDATVSVSGDASSTNSGINQVSDFPPLFVMCRRGINSQLALQLLLDHKFENVFNVVGGLTSWSKEVDPNFPLY